ncbi:class I SAM-dependent methyltransferase [Salinarimonas chemoclinalis]|uniref:class I SAM-dependent methyltransferase n=1 Tax=Salinarimonas chemoclinalis TaxID=3241599 RepID=UPI003556EB40
MALRIQSPQGAPARDAAGALAARYDAAAARWHDKITRLGYCRAYADLCRAFAPGAVPAGDAAALRVLDVGTGTGAFAAAFAEARGPGGPISLDLLDKSLPMLDEAARRLADAGLACRLIPGELGVGPLPAGTYDAVLCGHVVEHLPDPAAGLETLRAALRPGGLLLLVASKPHWCTRLLQWLWGHHALPEATVLHALERAGYVRAEVFAFDEGPPSRTSRGYAAWA